MFHNVVVTPDREANLRTYTGKSSRKISQPVKLNDYVWDKKVKYSIDKYVNYSNLS